MTDPIYSRLLMTFLFAVIIAQASFAAFPELDLAVSHALTDGAGSFVATHGPLPVLNAVMKWSMETVALLVVLGTLAGWVGGWLRGAALRCAIFATVNVLIAPALIVNLLLKANLGRARPVNITEFGGTANFTPAWQWADQCARNCSFTSGEVSVTATLTLCAVVLAWPWLNGHRRQRAVLAGLALVVIVAAMRVSLGRHFLSDSLFSGLISAGVALASYRVLAIGRARTQMGLSDLRPLALWAQSLLQTATDRAERWLRA
ncbi:hypothetical protein CCR83_02750 [Rhodobacter veldkampii DSM 11550]|uniref:Phosphoesterase n=1 Tax=Phaeovulum veldkampii DSM 11550 TaxID=1185920 RepID=A0A2T4JK40_9RHOB|nr:phosphatase PAP2 family protein [Phaeovulum veldkampii]MBK5945393.1 hypothetical protein [Phaeovulum veldkampii DSM 11550]PTE18266.1 phosphoesterase [Phaeovulum veldkampii DSM 11550]TDQ57739.1 PAP2 superfamily protein [Phaeovulum veldkampii DSM 11550]